MFSCARVIATTILALAPLGIGSAQTSGPRFASFPASVDAAPVTGRAFLILSRDSNPEPRFEIHPLCLDI